jgi:arginyl-tRNA synthetase
MTLISDIIAREVERVLGSPALIRPADPRFGDYQANGVMAVAKQQKRNPRELAESIISQLQLGHVSEPPTVAGPGFINFRLKRDFAETQVNAAARDNRLGVPAAAKPRTVVVDFCGVNVAKPMHVGHIRSTIIGDCLSRVMRYLGHNVITDNHIGDWGTQFGMLLLGWKQFRNEAALETDPIGELLRLYKLVNEREDLRTDAKAELVKLQQGDPENTAIWNRFIELSEREFSKIFKRLGVQFDHTLGESFYNPMLAGVVNDLRERGIASESDGAICVFVEGSKAPLIIQKADGAFLYGTTDLATLQYRIDHWRPDEIIYVTDGRQQLHFQQVFATAHKWLKEVPDLRHVWFGTILGEDGKPLKTRSGDLLKLGDLLDEAEERALAVVTEKNPELPEHTRKQIARAVGIGAVKYADLSQNRTTDYVFSWDKMLAMTGNTAPYMQYAYVRVQSIFRKAGTVTPDAPINLQDPAEIDLAKHILRFGETLQSVMDDDKPNWLTAYLFDLAGKFSTFYDNCPVLQSDEPVRSSRLNLCRLTADVIRQGLNLLGIKVIEQM